MYSTIKLNVIPEQIFFEKFKPNFGNKNQIFADFAFVINGKMIVVIAGKRA